ncbi:hypothetical protein Y1Q_0013604 [Alligator mississippiensis]|uniref:Uncharacterized protein n=1 Tax=Alligator mississippiensis TaxID=8496 RepID=A0A151P3M7_ALLMI|nr:hypothetical protein Y1Q_0013604 [Alligator mississippiensis]
MHLLLPAEPDTSCPGTSLPPALSLLCLSLCTEEIIRSIGLVTRSTNIAYGLYKFCMPPMLPMNTQTIHTFFHKDIILVTIDGC